MAEHVAGSSHAEARTGRRKGSMLEHVGIVATRATLLATAPWASPHVGVAVPAVDVAGVVAAAEGIVVPDTRCRAMMPSRNLARSTCRSTCRHHLRFTQSQRQGLRRVLSTRARETEFAPDHFGHPRRGGACCGYADQQGGRLVLRW